MKRPIIIDCDPGVDDALAIILALKSSELDLKAVCTVSGNGDIDNTTQNGLKILALCGREDIPLYRGSARALDDKQPDTVPAFGDDGLGGYAYTIETEKEEEEKMRLIFGRDSDRASGRNPEFPKKIKQLIIMGGAKYTGNMSPVAEYNFWADPLAAKEVLNAGFQDAVMIGLDVTNKIALGADVRELLRIFNTKLSNFLYNVTRVGLDDNWNSRRKPVAPMHDVLTVAYFIDPTILTLKKANIDVLTDGIGRGQSIVDINGHWNDGRCNAWYAAEVDVNKFYKLLLTTIFEEKKEEILEYLNR